MERTLNLDPNLYILNLAHACTSSITLDFTQPSFLAYTNKDNDNSYLTLPFRLKYSVNSI